MAMSGRALAARPWMLWQLGEDLGFSPPPLMKGRLAPRTPADEGREYGVCLQKLLVTSKDYFGENLGLRKFRFHVRHTMGWLLFGQHLFSGVTKAKTCLEVSEFLKSFFDRPQEMLPYTDLRE
jgi:tRNA-dihydrouridine synthase B